MTEIEKRRIVEMRACGRSYTEIAEELRMTAGSVKMFCQRNHLGGVRSSAKRGVQHHTPLCEQCARPVQQQEGRKRKRFCSDKCRMVWWSTHRDMVKRKTVRSFVCEACGNAFTAYAVKRRRFCSRRCSAHAHRREDASV